MMQGMGINSQYMAFTMVYWAILQEGQFHLFMDGNIASEANRILSFLQASGFNYENMW